MVMMLQMHRPGILMRMQMDMGTLQLPWQHAINLIPMLIRVMIVMFRTLRFIQRLMSYAMMMMIVMVIWIFSLAQAGTQQMILTPPLSTSMTMGLLLTIARKSKPYVSGQPSLQPIWMMMDGWIWFFPIWCIIRNTMLTPISIMVHQKAIPQQTEQIWHSTHWLCLQNDLPIWILRDFPQ